MGGPHDCTLLLISVEWGQCIVLLLQLLLLQTQGDNCAERARHCVAHSCGGERVSFTMAAKLGAQPRTNYLQE